MSRHFNYYDALFAGPTPHESAEKLPQYSHRLFGNSNVGNPAYTNLQVPWSGGLPWDATITSWYARTTLPTKSDEFRVFANYTVLWLNIGHHPVASMTLADLIDRSGAPVLYDAFDESPAARERRSETNAQYFASQIHELDKGLARHSSRLFYTEETALSRDEISERDRYLKLTKHAIKVIGREEWRVGVPARQAVDVSFSFFAAGYDAIRQLLRSYPQDKIGNDGKSRSSIWPGLWIHLAGTEAYEDHGVQ